MLGALADMKVFEVALVWWRNQPPIQILFVSYVAPTVLVLFLTLQQRT